MRSKTEHMKIIKKVLVCLSCLSLCALFCSCAEKENDIESGDGISYIIEFSSLDAARTHELKLTERDMVMFDVTHMKGTIRLSLTGEDGTVAFSDCITESKSFTVIIPKDGTYTITVDGTESSGRIIAYTVPRTGESGQTTAESSGPIAAGQGSTSGNISNGGLFCGYEGYVYYRSEADGWALTRAKPDGSGRERISEDIPSFINVLDGWIYYSNFSDGHKLYKIRTDGTERTRLTNCMTRSVTVTGNVIYYINWDNRDEETVNMLMSIGTDGTNNIRLADIPFSSVVTDGEYIYGESPVGGSIFPVFKMNMDGKSIKQLTEGQYAHFINVTGRYIFYWSVNEYRLRRMNRDGTDNVVITDFNVDYVNADDDYVYFLNVSDNYNIYRADHDGSGLLKLSDIKADEPGMPSYNPTALHVIDGYVFYRAFDSEETGDALFVIPPGSVHQELWDGKEAP